MIPWEQPRRTWRGFVLVMAGVVAAIIVGFPGPFGVLFLYWLIVHHIPARRRRRIARHGDACAQCWGLFEPADARHPYTDNGRRVYLCDEHARALHVLPAENADTDSDVA